MDFDFFRIEYGSEKFFLYVNADPKQIEFSNKLDFEWAIIPYVSKDYTWVEKTIIEIKNFLELTKYHHQIKIAIYGNI